MEKIDKRKEANRKRIKIAPLTCGGPCPIERGMRIIGGKWTGSILWHLKDKPVRFNELGRTLAGASKKVLNERLKDMEANGLVKRVVISDRPIAVSYELTEFGRTALDILKQLKDWCETHEL